MATFEIRDEAIDEAEIQKRVEENLRRRNAGGLDGQEKEFEFQSKEMSESFFENFELRENLRFLRDLVEDLPDYKIFGAYKTLRRFAKKQIAIDKALPFLLYHLTEQNRSLHYRVRELESKVKALSSRAADSEGSEASGRSDG